MVSTLHRYWVYILASQARGTLYIGVTNDILGRTDLHRAKKGSGFTSKYGVSILVYFEEFARIDEAIQREKSLKRYLRAWKIDLIEHEPAVDRPLPWARGAQRLRIRRKRGTGSSA